MRHRRSGRGFTAIEALIAVAVLAILLAIGLPGLQRHVAAHAVQSNVQQFESALRLARSQAARRGITVSLCLRDGAATSDAPRCADTAAAGWQTGWLVFADGGAVGVREAGDELIAVQPALTASGRVSSSRRSVSFHPLGIALAGTGSYTFRPAGPADDAALQALAVTVCVNKPGRPRAVPAAVGCA